MFEVEAFFDLMNLPSVLLVRLTAGKVTLM